MEKNNSKIYQVKWHLTYQPAFFEGIEAGYLKPEHEPMTAAAVG